MTLNIASQTFTEQTHGWIEQTATLQIRPIVINLKSFVFDDLFDSINNEKPLFLIVITNVTYRHTSTSLYYTDKTPTCLLYTSDAADE